MRAAVRPPGMNDERTAATVGVGACVLTAVAVVAPYVLLPATAQQYVGAYYGVGPVNPLALGLLGAVGAVVFASGREQRSSPDLVAGVMLSVGLFSLVVGAVWALGFDPGAAGGDVPVDFFSTHRWVVLAGAALEVAAAGWYAGALGLVPLGGSE